MPSQTSYETTNIAWEVLLDISKVSINLWPGDGRERRKSNILWKQPIQFILCGKCCSKSLSITLGCRLRINLRALLAASLHACALVFKANQFWTMKTPTIPGYHFGSLWSRQHHLESMRAHIHTETVALSHCCKHTTVPLDFLLQERINWLVGAWKHRSKSFPSCSVPLPVSVYNGSWG